MKTDTAYKIYLTPWDFDLTFGEKWNGNEYLHWSHDTGVIDDIYNFEYSKRVLDVYEGAKEFVRRLSQMTDVYVSTAVPPQFMGIRAQRILELNPAHPAVKAMQAALVVDTQKAKDYVNLLHAQALLMADLPIEDPAAYTALVCKLMQ